MVNTKATQGTPKKVLPIIYILDCSGSMEGARIAAVNSAMTETVEVLKEVAANNPNVELKIGVLKFASGADWITSNGLVYMEDYFWTDIQAGGLTDFGSALDELDKKLSRNEFLGDPEGYKKPVLIFMSDGEPTDDYLRALQRIKDKNKWFNVSSKIAVGVGEDVNIDVLEDIAGNSEAVIQVTDLETLKKLIKVVSVRASEIGSKSRLEEDGQAELSYELKKTFGNDIMIHKNSNDGSSDFIIDGLDDEDDLINDLFDNDWG